jgi:hypothetical protein
MQQTRPQGLTRRALLRSCGVTAAAAGLVAACGRGAAPAFVTSTASSVASTAVTSTLPVTSTASTTGSAALVATTSAASAATAATTSSSAAPSTSGVKTGAVALSFSTWGAGGSAYSAEQHVVDAFNQAHPDIQASVLQIDFGGYRDKIVTMAAGGDEPHNMAIDHERYRKQYDAPYRPHRPRRPALPARPDGVGRCSGRARRWPYSIVGSW